MCTGTWFSSRPGSARLTLGSLRSFPIQMTPWFCETDTWGKKQGSLPQGGFPKFLKCVVTDTKSVSIFKFISPFKFASITCNTISFRKATSALQNYNRIKCSSVQASWSASVPSKAQLHFLNMVQTSQCSATNYISHNSCVNDPRPSFLKLQQEKFNLSPVLLEQVLALESSCAGQRL